MSGNLMVIGCITTGVRILALLAFVALPGVRGLKDIIEHELKLPWVILANTP